MDGHFVTHNRQSVKEIFERFKPIARDKIVKEKTNDPSRKEVILQASFYKGPQTEKNPRKKTLKKKTILSKLWDYSITLILSVVGGVITWFVIRWLKGRRGKPGSDDGMSGLETLENNGMLPLRARRTDNTKEVTLVKRSSDSLMLPQVRRALLEGFNETEWGGLIEKIVDARFEGEYDERMKQARLFLRKTFHLDIDDLLMRSPTRTSYFLRNESKDDSVRSRWLRGIRKFIGRGEKPLPLSGFDIYRIMSRRTSGGIGLGTGDSLQVALLWALKETGIAFQAIPSHQASDDFITLAKKFQSNRFINRQHASPAEELLNKVNYQLRNGCRCIHEHAFIAHLTHYLFERWNDTRLSFILTDMLGHKDYLNVARDLERHDLTCFAEDMHRNEFAFTLSLKSIITARLKYLAAISGTYDPAENPRNILEQARLHAIESLQQLNDARWLLRTYRSYVKDVAKDIGKALDVFKGESGGSQNGGALPANDNELNDAVPSPSGSLNTAPHKATHSLTSHNFFARSILARGVTPYRRTTSSITR